MILIVDMNWKKASLAYNEFVSPIVSAVGTKEKYATKHYLDVKNEDLHECSKIILSGTALKDTATLSQPEKFQWLKKTDKPLLGICAGMETMGIVFGMPIVKSLEIGMTQITTVRENQFFSGNFRAYSLHSFCVKATDDFEVLAKSSKCIQAIKHKRKMIYGILFHPEVRNTEILTRFVNSEQ